MDSNEVEKKNERIFLYLYVVHPIRSSYQFP